MPCEISPEIIKQVAEETGSSEEAVKAIASLMLLPTGLFRGPIRCLWWRFRCKTCLGPLRRIYNCLRAALCAG